MLEPINGRTMFYGKHDVLTYRTYAKPLLVSPISESSFTGCDNIIFAHNISFAVTGEAFLTSFSQGDNSMVVATDSMKNFILRNSADYTGSTTEGLLQLLSSRFMDRYNHVTSISITAHRIPFEQVMVPCSEGLKQSQLVLRHSNNESYSASLTMQRGEDEPEVISHECNLKDLQLIKVSGSSFYGFVQDEYTTLPESYDRPLYIFLNIDWTYSDVQHALDGDAGQYVAVEQVRDIAHSAFHELSSPSIQSLIYQIGIRVLTRFPQLATVSFESNNRTWETIVEPTEGKGGVFTEPRPPYGFQGFSVSRADLAEATGTLV
ncbi:factor-independent urate hydroxylase [Paenibacillus crassostreae]|uniref:Uricase n=1 Tax=Paenibacillus crassostreae TaxID=1763538 RepID=A0A167B4S5_9BACL|nr:urate oxidase [Paenibacillus crassostreae]AOZ93169.1 urate oxidase [Paenibacillus crassostreae]OAB71740.1 urate oxidase [Paenibacillus crassostreae]